MINFLIKITSEGDLVDIIWSEPAYLFLSSSDNLFQQIEFDQWSLLKRDIEETAKSKNAIVSMVEYKLKISQVNIRLILIQQQSHFLILGQTCEDSLSMHSTSHQLTLRLLETVAKLDNHQALFSDASKTNYYEKIQALNNDLINMQRQLHKANAQLNHLNKTLNNRLIKDPLTGLISRYQFEDEITHLISKAPNAYGVFAFIDLDDFKLVNDTYGHQVGDEYLKVFATRLSLIGVADLLKMRIAGDEFGLYSHGYTLEKANLIIEQIQSEVRKSILSNPVSVDRYTIPLKLSIGFAIFNFHSDNVYQLIDYADFAMYQAKRNGKGSFKVFDMNQFMEFKSHQRHE